MLWLHRAIFLSALQLSFEGLEVRPDLTAATVKAAQKQKHKRRHGELTDAPAAAASSSAAAAAAAAPAAAASSSAAAAAPASSSSSHSGKKAKHSAGTSPHSGSGKKKGDAPSTGRTPAERAMAAEHKAALKKYAA